MVKKQLVSLFLLVSVLLSACAFLPSSLPTSPPSTSAQATPTAVDVTQDPDGVANAFLSAWMAGDYAGMYSLLSPNSQLEYSLEEFTDTYATTAGTMTQVGVEAAPLSALQSTGTTAQLVFHVKYTTHALGEIEQETTMNLVFDDERWGVAWTPALIFPELAGGNTLQLEVETPARANIYDRNGQWLVAANAEAFTVQIVPGEISSDYEGRMLNLLSQVLRIPPDEIRQNYAGLPEDQYWALGDADAETIQANWSALSSYPGLYFAEKTGRRYFNLLAPHVLGYTSFIPEEQLDAYKGRGYRGDEIVGLSGLELWGETYLAGTPGGILSAYTPSGEYFAEVARRNPQPAQAVYTTIDKELQAIVQDAIEAAYRVSTETWAPTSGGAAVVVLDVNSGDVLAMASYPYFDPNVLHPYNNHPQATPEYLSNLFNDPRKPFLNRATQGLYPAGSIFKIISAATALGSGLYDPDTTYTCTGVWDGLGSDPENLRYDWYEEGHGTLNLPQALTASCNPYFYQVGFVTGKEDFSLLADYARQFGLGQELGIQIAEEAGQVPDPDWLWRERGEQWDIADSVNVAIGQGPIQVTPLQMAVMVATIANGGTVYQPQLVDRIGLIGEEPTLVFEPVVLNTVPLEPGHFEAIREGMRGVVNNPTIGTAQYRLGSMGISAAGKTGTAQVSKPGAPPIAWFIGFVPYEEPELAIAVMVENSGQGSGVAAPIFRRIVERWYGLSVLPYPGDWSDPELFDFVTDEVLGE
jgi:penicillin-binding protein 2